MSNSFGVKEFQPQWTMSTQFELSRSKLYFLFLVIKIYIALDFYAIYVTFSTAI